MSTSICIQHDIKLSSHSESIFINFGNFTILPEQRFSSRWPLYYTYTLFIWTSIYGCRGFFLGGGGVKGWRRARPPKAWNANCWLVKTGSPVFLGRNSWADCCTRRIGAELSMYYSSYGHFLESPLLKKGLSHHLCTPPFTESYL